MNKNISIILAELYQIDPEFRKREAELVKIIQKLLKSRPDTKFDKAFAKRLRASLLAEKQIKAGMSDFINNFNIMKKFAYAFGGAAIATILIVPVLFLNNFDLTGKSLVDDSGMNVEPSITILGDNAFGSLSSASGVAQESALSDLTASADAKIRTQAGGGGGSFGAGAPASTSLIYPAPDGDYAISQYRYVYTGEPVEPGEDKLEVLRRKIGSFNVGGLSSQLSLGLVDLNKLGSLKFENIMMVENRVNGYRVSIDVRNGEIYIGNDGPAMAEEQYQVLTPDKIIPDEQIIEIANEFVHRIGLNLDSYGEPVLQENYYQTLDLARSNSGEYYLPEFTAVVYPLEVNGIRVYDQGGSLYGVSVNVNLRTKQAIAASGITVQQYDSSLYEVETDIAALLKLKEESEAYYPKDAQIEYVDVELGSPELVFNNIYQFGEQGYNWLLVPSYKFPVVKKPAGDIWYADNIIVPLVKDLINPYGNGGPIRIMEGTSGAAEPATVDLPPAIEPQKE